MGPVKWEERLGIRGNTEALKSFTWTSTESLDILVMIP